MRFKLNLLPCLKTFKEVIESYQPKPFLNYKKVTFALKSKADALNHKMLKVIDYGSHYSYKDNDIFIKENSEYSCSCASYLDKAICKHIVLFCIINKKSIPGLSFNEKFSIRKAQRNRRFKYCVASSALDLD